jgi:DNA-binding transcriptional regulator YdaS (Cro superfamily)
LLRIVQQAADRVGSMSELARRLGIKHPALYKWKQVPASRVLRLEEISGVSRHDIRPDIYPRDK